MSRNDLRKRSGLFISKGFPFQYCFEKNCGTSLTLLPSVGIKTRWWAPKIELICSNSLLIVLLKGPQFHSQDLIDVVNQLHEIFKKTLRKGEDVEARPSLKTFLGIKISFKGNLLSVLHSKSPSSHGSS